MILLERLTNLAGGVGLMLFDETFKFLDNAALDVAIERLKNVVCEYIFIISHNNSFPYYDKLITVDKVEGSTKYFIN